MKTAFANSQTIRRDWYVVDASNQTLGRLASQLASRLRGKHKPEFTPHADTGDYIIVVNAAKIRVTGEKLGAKAYHRHTGYLGNLKTITLNKLLETAPERAIEHAVRGMLPRNPLGRRMLKKLRVFRGAEHDHEAQQPIELKF